MAKKLNIKDFDFGGWATRFNTRCSDGRIIKPEAFDLDDGMKVPLVWNHNHADGENVIGHAYLEKREDGMYTYAKFNNSASGLHMKESVRNGDITSLSIFANKLKQKGPEVVHGKIRELSLVLAGANPGAYIDTVLIHSAETNDESYDAVIFNNSESLDLNLEHAEKDETQKEGKNMPEENKTPAAQETKPDAGKEKTIQDVFNTLNEEQKNVVYAMIGLALEEAEDKEKKEEITMKHNAFENYENQIENDTLVLSHSDITEIIKLAKEDGKSLKKVTENYLKNNDQFKHADASYGIENIDVLFPNAQSVNGGTPQTINENNEWVNKVMTGVKALPFARIKSTQIDITGDKARARGYLKGNRKLEEVVVAATRETTPQTIYKKQKLDRDDIIDIVDFNVVAWMKSEMQVKLHEEIARAILIGDGRDVASVDKIKTTNIRPILGDDPLYTISKSLTKVANEEDDVFTKRFMKEIVKSRKEYRGSGNPTLFTTEDILTNMLLLEDSTGRVIYESAEKLRNYLRVSSIVTVTPMEAQVRTDAAGENEFTPLAILVNLSDYATGTNAGGKTQLFNDFDIDFNQEKYLIETRLSGALIVPHSAITFELKTAKNAG